MHPACSLMLLRINQGSINISLRVRYVLLQLLWYEEIFEQKIMANRLPEHGRDEANTLSRSVDSKYLNTLYNILILA